MICFEAKKKVLGNIATEEQKGSSSGLRGFLLGYWSWSWVGVGFSHLKKPLGIRKL